jgi:putative SOS response-associated peptidase YedK
MSLVGRLAGRRTAAIDSRSGPHQPHRVCNLYRMARAASAVAGLFNAVAEPGNAGGEFYPGYVVAQGRLRQMTWGFPLKLKGMKPGTKPKPVNTRADKLDSFMWRYSFAERRCLIPVTEFAEAEGEKGSKTRTGSRCPMSRCSRSRASGGTRMNGDQPIRW